MLGFLIVSLAIMAGGREYSVELPIERVAREVSITSQGIEHQIVKAEDTLAVLQMQLERVNLELASTVDMKERNNLWYKEMAIRSEITKVGYQLVTDLNGRLKELKGKVGVLRVLFVEASDRALKSAEEMAHLKEETQQSLEEAGVVLRHIHDVWQTIRNDPVLSEEVKRIAWFKEMQRSEEEQILHSTRGIAHACSTYSRQSLEVSRQVQDCEDQVAQIIGILNDKTALLQTEARLGQIMIENQRGFNIMKETLPDITLPNLEGVIGLVNKTIETSLPRLDGDIGSPHLMFNILGVRGSLSDKEMEKLGGD